MALTRQSHHHIMLRSELAKLVVVCQTLWLLHQLVYYLERSAWRPQVLPQKASGVQTSAKWSW